MASRLALLIAMAVVVDALLPATAWPDNHVVGELDGWTLGVNFTNWARFNDGIPAGGTLEFIYQAGDHTVVMVPDQDSYNECVVPNNNNVRRWDSGDDKVQLSDPGRTYYFICDVADNCLQGMKLAITTI